MYFNVTLNYTVNGDKLVVEENYVMEIKTNTKSKYHLELVKESGIIFYSTAGLLSVDLSLLYELEDIK